MATLSGPLSKNPELHDIEDALRTSRGDTQLATAWKHAQRIPGNNNHLMTHDFLAKILNHALSTGAKAISHGQRAHKVAEKMVDDIYTIQRAGAHTIENTEQLKEFRGAVLNYLSNHIQEFKAFKHSDINTYFKQHADVRQGLQNNEKYMSEMLKDAKAEVKKLRSDIESQLKSEDWKEGWLDLLSTRGDQRELSVSEQKLFNDLMTTVKNFLVNYTITGEKAYQENELAYNLGQGLATSIAEIKLEKDSSDLKNFRDNFLNAVKENINNLEPFKNMDTQYRTAIKSAFEGAISSPSLSNTSNIYSHLGIKADDVKKSLAPELKEKTNVKKNPEPEKKIELKHDEKPRPHTPTRRH